MYGEFTWWQGVVEDRNDPLKLGRCRVRVLGYHTDKKTGYYSIPTEGSTYQVCDNCQIPLEVKPISIKIKFKKPTKLKKVKEKVVINLLEDGKEDAKNIIKTYGFSAKEIDNVLDTLGTDGMAIETIVKEVLARIDNKHEPATT